MYEFYNENDVIVGKQETLRGFTVDEEYYKLDGGSPVVNGSYDPVAALDSYLYSYIRDKRSPLLKVLDSLSPPTLTGAEQTEIDDYKQELRDLTNGVTMADVDSTTFPTKPQILIDLGY